jgi:hypothetical protein
MADALLVELEEIGPALGSLVVKIGGLKAPRAIDCLANAGKNFKKCPLFKGVLVAGIDFS